MNWLAKSLRNAVLCRNGPMSRSMLRRLDRNLSALGVIEHSMAAYQCQRNAHALGWLVGLATGMTYPGV